MPGHECYHCKNWVEEGEPHDCWTTTEAALTRELSEDLQDAYARLRETAAEFGQQRIYASHKAIMFARKACYFFVRPKRNFLEVVFFLGRPVKAPHIRSARQTSQTKIAHTIHVKHRDEVEEPIADWLREAFETSDALSGRVKEKTKATKNSERRTKNAERKKAKKTVKRKRVGLAILLAFGASIATAAAQTAAPPADTRITLERTACFGTCPAYTVALDAAGNVTYVGRQHVRVTGLQRARVPAERVRGVLEIAERIGFFALKDRYPLNTDSPDQYPDDHGWRADEPRRLCGSAAGSARDRQGHRRRSNTLRWGTTTLAL